LFYKGDSIVNGGGEASGKGYPEERRLSRKLTRKLTFVNL